MFKNIGNILKFGEGKKIKKYEEIVSAVSNLEKEISLLTDRLQRLRILNRDMRTARNWRI